MKVLRYRRISGAFLIGALWIAGIAPPVYAHTVSDGRATPLTVAITVGGILATAAGVLLAYRGRRKPGLGIFIAGVVLLSVAMTGLGLEGGSNSSPAKVRILEPAWGARVTSPFAVKVELTDGVLVPLDRTEGPPTEGHLHLYANGRAIGMYDEPEASVELPPGKYVLQVEFTGADHHSFSPPVGDTIEVEVVSGGG